MTTTKTATATGKKVATTKTVRGFYATASKVRWPTGLLGDQPNDAAFAVAHTFNKPGTAVAMAWAMYARPGGATDEIAAMAATLLTGSKSASHRVKCDQAAALGQITRKANGQRDGKTVYVIALPKKAAGKRKPASKGKAAAPAEKPANDANSAN